MNDNRTILYNALKNEGYTDIGENQEEFNKLLEKPENVRVAYDAMRNSGYTDIGDSYEEFAAMLVPNVEQKTTAPVPAQQPKGGENGFTLTGGELGLKEEAVEEQKKSRVRQKWEALKGDGNEEEEDDSGAIINPLTPEQVDEVAQQVRVKVGVTPDVKKNATPNHEYGWNAKHQKQQSKKQQKVEAEQKVETIEAVRTDFSELDDASKVKTLERMFGKSINEIEDDFLAATDRRVNGDYDLLFRWATGGNLKANELTMDAVVDKRAIAGKRGYTPAQIEAGVADDDTTMKYMADKQMAELEEGLDSIEAEIKAKAGEAQANWEKEKPAGWDIAMALSTTDQRGMTSADAVRDAMSINGIPTEEAQEVARQLDMINYTRQNIAKAKNLQALAQAEGGGGKQFVAGMGAAILDPDTWTSAEEIKRGQALQGVLDKINDEGEGSLTQAEQKFLESVVMLTAYNEMYAEDLSASAGAGKSFMESIPLMFEMAINPLRGTGKAAGKKLLKWAEKRFRSNVLKKGTQVLGNIAGSVAAGYGTAATMQLPGTIAGVQERMQGDVVVDTDEDGKLVYGGQKNEKGAATAVYEEFTERMLDTASEMIGAGYASLPFRQLRKWGKGTKVLGWIDNLANSRFGKTLGNFFERTGWHGPIEEFMEEVHVGLLSPALLRDPKLKDFFNEKDLTTTLIAVAVPGAITSSLRTAVGAYDGSFKLGAQEKWKMQSADRTARTLWGENIAQWDEIKSRLDNGSIENTEETLSEIDQAIKDVYADETLTNEQKKVALQYAVYSLQYKTAIGVSEAITDERQKMLNEMLNGRYEEGYNTDPDTVNGSTIALANKSLDDAETAVRVALGLQNDASIEDFVGGRSVDEVAMGDEAVADALYTYLEEKARYDGMSERLNAERESEIIEADNSVDAVAHEDGNVYMTTLPSTGEVIYITGGTVVLDNDGYIDVNQSEGLVALMPNSKKEAIQAGNIREKVAVENAEAQKAVKRAEIDARYKSQLNTFVYSDSEGDHTVMLVGRRGDMVDALIDGRPTEVPAKEFEAIMADATGKQPVVEGGEVKAEGATSGDVVSPVETTQPIEQPGLSNGLSNETAQTETAQPQVVAPKVAEVPDFFRMDGKNYAVVSRNEDGSVTVDVDGKRVVLLAETNFTTAVPTDKGGKVLFTEMPAEKTLEYFVQRVPNSQARAQMIENNRKQAESALTKFDKEPNVGTDPDAYEAAMNKWEAGKKAAQAKVDYWNEVAKRDAEISQSEMRESVEAVKPREVIEMTPDEFVANQLGGIKITPESFQKETGTKAEQKQMVGVIAGKEKGGVSIERAAEIIYESYGDELRGLGFNGDMQDVRDMIIDVLSNGNPRSFAKKGLEMRQQTDVEQQLAELRGVANALNFESIEEQIAYEESIVPRIMQELKGFDETEYFNNLAENYENDTTRESESTRGSSELLQGEQFADNTGDTNLGEPGQGGKVQGDVYSGGENATSQGNQQVSGSEIPNGSTISQASDQVVDHYTLNSAGNSTQMLKDMEAVRKSNREEYGKISPAYELFYKAKERGLYPNELEELRAIVKGTSLESKVDGWFTPVMAEGGNAPGQSGVAEIKEPTFTEEVLENGDKRITNYNSRGEVATVVTEHDGKVVSVDSYDEGVLFEHTEYDGGGKAASVTRYDKQGNAIGTQVYVDGKAKASHPVADKVLETAKKKQQARFADHAKGVAEKLGVEVTVHNDESTVTNKDAMKAIAEGGEVKGWYNPVTGEIALYMPNMESMRDVESTILHEAVSHYGIKHLLGQEDFDKFLDGVWDMMPAALRAHFLQYVGADMANPSKAKMRQAADEYVAHIAEKMDLNELEKSVWQRFIDYVMNVLRKAGFKNLKQRDVEAVIRASYANLRKNGNVKTENGKVSQVTGQGETMASKKMSERRQEKNRINNVLDEVGGIIYGNKEYAKKQRLKREAERKELAKEIYSSVLKGDFNDVTLSQIDKFIEDATPANPFGRRISQRLPQRMERALRQGARANAVDALFSRISESAVPANERFSEAGRREIEERKKELLKGWAIATGNWHTDLKEFTDDTEPIGEGKDSKVYSSKDGRYVIKASKGKPFGKRFRPDIDNIALFNDVFRDTRYEILGYGEIDGEFVRILQQPIVDFAESTPLTSEERREYMQSLGFEPLNDANTAFADGEIVIADLQKGNVVRDAAGNISVIDADAKLHTKDVGGDYTYPPVETDLPEGTDLGSTMFRKANYNQEVFVSNAQRAVEGIKQEKATPEQWLAMLKKNGGLKAGEEAWMGLSEWLENNESKSLTKQEVLDFVNENTIKIEEVRYSQFGSGMMNEASKKLEAETKEIGWDAMQEKYPGIEDFFEYYNGEVLWSESTVSEGEYEDFILDNKIVDANPADNAINEHRESYTTEGLERKREIALVVPTIEPYNQSDEIHFGDAGEGRAVAWVRFGETTDSEGNRVLVIDEIQSKRHQDGREKGYRGVGLAKEVLAAEEEVRKTNRELTAYREPLKEKYNFKELGGSMFERLKNFDAMLSEEERITMDALGQARNEAEKRLQELRGQERGIPSAPFEKNWYELAMKRMLRLAAEEGFDKVAWTTGEQQAERYNIAKVVSHIECEKVGKNGNKSFSMGLDYKFIVDPNGIVVNSKDEYIGKSIADIVGKPLANKMLEMQEGDTISGDGLRIGGEGMKGFYDKMLPSFVQKYTKKWGAKVGTVEMPSLEQNNVMHSVDVTPEMKESVMEGQTMFRRGNRNDRNFENKNITLHTTGDGRIVRYEQLELFDTDERTTTDIQRGASGGNQTADNRTRTGDIQRDGLAGGDALTLINAPLRPLEEGETSLVQRVFTKSKAFDFTAGEQIESLEDVAYIFKNLEDESIENSFAVLVKDGKPVVLHLGMGHYTSSIINASAVAVAMENVKPDKVYLVHNHPSGALRASNEDVAALEGFRTIYGDIVEKGIIINLKSGKFGIYDTAKETNEERSTKAEGGADVPVETFTFNKQVFDKDFNPAELFQVKNDSDVAAFISSNRLGDRNKIGLLVCNNQNRVVGNVFTPFVGITAASAKKVAKEIVYYTTVMGGNRPVLFGRFPALSAAAKSNLGAYIGLYSGGTIKLLDMVDVESRESVLYEDEMVYGDKSVDNSLNVQEERTLFSKKELTPEQKKKALKENAKAIRRLHNVTSRFPITVLRYLGFALETQEQREMHDSLFAERDAITGESMPAGLQTNPQAMTLQERITESLLKHAEQEKENVEMRLSAIRAYGRDLANVIKLMNAQKVYDRNTVRIFTDLVKMYLRNNAMSGMSSYKIIRLLNLMQKATGGHAKTVNGAAVKIAEIITNEHTSQLEEIMEKQMKTGAERVNASGVVVQGGVDIIGKRILNTYKDAINLDDEGFEEKYNDSFKRVGEIQKQLEENGSNTALENQLKEAQAEADAMLLAATYRNEVKAAEADITKIKNELTGKRTKAEKGEITWKEYHEFAKTINSQIVQLRAQQIDAYQKVLHALSGDIYEGVQRARAFREAEAMRVQRIHDMAESDMNGVDKSAERKEPGAAGKTVDMVVYKNPIVRTVMNGLGTYENYMKYFGRDHLDGRGELFNHFMTAFNEAQDKEWKESQNDFNILEAAAQKIFDKKIIGKTYKTIARESTKGSGVILSYWNGGATVERELTIGQLMYLYMTEKQAEGQMKLRNMGLTEEKVQGAVKKLPAKYKKFADYIQAEFLPQMRPRMNEVHQRMFGASMSEVENYFPLRVNKDARQGNEDINNTSDAIPSTITGSIIKRRVNVTPIDLMANAFDVLNEHIVDMEHWAAYAEFIRDNNTLINDKDFKNRVQNTKSVRYGDGETLWKDFVDTARIATGNYKPKADYLAKLMSGANAAKITYGGFTSLKQIASLPAFLGDANVFDLMWTASTPVGWWSSWNWAIKNLPGFEERWKGRTAGNERLGENEYSIYDSRIMKAARMVGMTPNAFIDAVVVASGARAVYNTRLRFYKSLGLTEYEADKRAKNDAAISYNETQQSGQGAYLSSLQKDGGLVALLTTLFRNSQMAFQRRVVGSMVGIGKKLARGERIREATKQKYIKMGVDEVTAGKQATKEFYKSYAKDFTNLAIFGYGMNYLWVLMGQLPYLLFGDDEEEKEKIYDMAKKVGVTGMFEGFTLGNFAKGLYEKHITDGKYAVGLLEAPFEGDLQKVIDSFEKDGTAAGILQLGIILTEMNTGISPQRLIDLAAAFIDVSDGDVKLANDGVLLGLRILEAPQSQQDMLILDEIYGADAEKVKKVADRYIEYKMTRNFPLGSEDEKRVDKYANKFVETLKERVEKEYSPEDISVIYDQSSDTEKEILKKKWIEGMDERNGTNVAKSLRKEKLEELLGSPVENAATKALHKYSKVNTYEKLETFEDLERWYEYKVLHDKFKSDYEKIRDGEELSPEERAKAVEHYGVYADKGFKEVINAIGAHKKFIKQNKDPEWRMSEVRRLTDIATEIMKRYE